MKNNRKRSMRLLLTMAALWVALAMPMLANAQVGIDWQQSYGSLANDWAFGIVPSGSGYAVLGQANAESSSGMFECNFYYMPRVATWLFGIDDEGGETFDWQNCDTYGSCQKLHSVGDDKYYITGLANDNNYLTKLRVLQTDVIGNVLWGKILRHRKRQYVL